MGNKLQESKRELFGLKRELSFREGTYNINIYRLRVPSVPSVPSIFPRVEGFFSLFFFPTKKRGGTGYSRNVLFLEGTEGTRGTFVANDTDRQKKTVPSKGQIVPSMATDSGFLCLSAYRFYIRFPLCQMMVVFKGEVVGR